MVKPNFVCGPHNVSPEHPSDSTIPVMQSTANATSLGGVTTRDVAWRKYQYELHWEHMSLNDFEALEDLVNYSNDNGVPITFSYEKYRQTNTQKQVLVDLIPRDNLRGSGKDAYYQKVTVRITEINPR